MSALLFAFVLLSGFLPARSVAAALPALWLTQNTLLGERATLLHAGPVDVTTVDAIIVLLLGKLLLSLIQTRELAVDRPLYLAIGAFFVVNFLATLVAGAKFGGTPMLRSFTALARFASEIAIVPILAQTITSLPQAKRGIGIVVGTLVVLGVIQFVNFFGASHGFAIGEVQGVERGELRFFGPVGDSIGFVLLLGYILALCFAKPAGVLLFAGGIVLTAGFGAIFGMIVATGLVVLFGLEPALLRTFARRYLWLAPALVVAGLVVAATVGRPMAKTLTDRFGTGKYHASGTQRVASTTLGLAMIEDNPLSGVGFMGYEGALERYGGGRYFNLAKHDGGTANANNQWIQTLTDSGLFGLLAFAALIATAARVFLQVSARCDDRLLRISFRAACIWLLAQVCGNLAAVWIIPSSTIARLLWVLLGIAIATGRLLPGCVVPGSRGALAPSR